MVLRLDWNVVGFMDHPLNRHHFDDCFIVDMWHILLTSLHSHVLDFSDLFRHLLYRSLLLVFYYFFLDWHFLDPLSCLVVYDFSLKWHILYSTLSFYRLSLFHLGRSD